MEDPESQISSIIHTLCQTPPSAQAATIAKYFLETASFAHPFIRTGSWDFGNGWNSRWAIQRVYRWYKIMSPSIVMSVDSVAIDYGGDRVNGTAKVAYATVRQKFKVWLLPFYLADVKLVVRLDLVYDRHWRRYYIKSQEDCYPVTEYLKFLQFGLWWFAWLWQILCMFVCIILAWLGSPVTWWEEKTQTVQGSSVTTQLRTAWQNTWLPMAHSQKVDYNARASAGAGSIHSDTSEKTHVEDGIVRIAE